MALSTLLFNIILAVLTRIIRQEKEIRNKKFRKEEVKLSLFRQTLYNYLKTTQNSANNKIIITEVVGNKNNLWKSVVFM